MTETLPISAYMITLNEEENIGQALDHLTRLDQVIIVDSGSCDRTLEIAKGYPNVTVHHNDWPGFSEQKALALSLCRNEWVLNVDADEIITEDYLTEAERVMKDGGFNGMEANRVLLRWGKRPRCFNSRDRVLRFFRRSEGFYEPRRVHESITVTGNIAQSSCCMLHRENLPLGERVRKANSYSEASALDRFERGKQPSALAVGLVFPLSFLQTYLFKGHFLDGVSGFLTSMNHAYYSFLKYAKLYEMRHIRKLEAPKSTALQGRKSNAKPAPGA